MSDGTKTLYPRLPRVAMRVATAAVLVLAATGCGSVSLSQVKQFGLSTSALGDSARKAFDLAGTTSVDRQLYDVAGDPAKGVTTGVFEGLFGADERAQQLALRLNVLDQLGNYASALQQLAAADYGKDIDAAAKDLNGSLVGLRNTFQKAAGRNLPISDADIGIVATAVDAIGRGVVEAKRRSAIKTVITRADPAIQEASRLIATDLGASSELAGYVTAAIANSRGSIQQAYNLERGRPVSTFESRYAMLVRARQLYEAERAAPAFFGAVSDGAKTVGQAHAALRKAVEGDDFSSAEAGRLIGELEGYVKSVQSFYKSVKPRD